MKDDTILLLAGVGIVGYGLLKSDFFKGVGDVGTGVGDAFAGVGSGIGTIGQSIGMNTSDLLGIIGQMSRTSTEILREGGTHTQTIIREIGKDTSVIVDKTLDVPKDVSTLASNWSGFFKETWSPRGQNSIFENIGKGGKYILDKITNKNTTPPPIISVSSAIPQVFTTAKVSSIKTPTTPVYSNSSSKSNDLVAKMRQQGLSYLAKKK